MDIVEAQENLLDILEELAYKFHLNTYYGLSNECSMMIVTVKLCCRNIGIDNKTISERYDIGQQKAIDELKE